MSLWISLYLPTLSLDVCFPQWPIDPRPAAVLQQDRVCACTPAAQAQGVRPGMRSSTLRGLVPGIELAADRPAARQQHLHDTALGLLQYTPNVAFFEAQSIVLEVSASLDLFKGPRTLLRRIRLTLQSMGVNARSGMAPTALGAWILASQTSSAQRHCLGLHTLRRRLDLFPPQALPAARPYAAWLDGIGCRSLSQLRGLPRAGLQQRSSPLLVQELDAAYGASAYGFNWFQAPDVFSQRIDLIERLEHSHAVLAFSRRLIEQLCGWLQARHRATQVLEFLLHHEKGRHARPPTPMVLRLSEKAWLPEDFLSVLQEQVQALSLGAAVIAITLSVNTTTARPAASAGLFPEPAQWMRQEHRLLDLLRARLGGDRVLHAQPAADYRPEHANLWGPMGAATAKPPLGLPPRLTLHSRPFWLLPRPVALATANNRPIHDNEPLRLVQGPERLESGWWNASGHDQRDYFIAQDRHGARYWLYRQRENQHSGWFLHGLFG
ncbi:DNA polymerase Y family protein [Pusillimonas sp. SM2304]|uniref:Y-family DNA polymerase n=1 Tax=Pusillimonas sp. SM2304 TaxID=3073241 RepID=UPI002875BA61|nr:DNA polymerase Y family protein [Pusillimonas sp. SM2304]MDS1141632.1 DNA polymerase Y family protein [Pusillimonas sp. SM2304]